MEIIKLIIAILKAIAWPTVVLIIILMFRKQIKRRIDDLDEVELPGGFKAKLSDKRVSAIMEETANEIKKIVEEKGVYEERTKKVSISDTQELKQYFMVQMKRLIEPAEPAVTELKSKGSETILNKKSEDNRNTTMLVFAAGQSYNENITYDLYYDPVGRKHNTPFTYIGLYTDGSISAVGKLNKIVYCDYEEGELVGTNSEDLSRLSKNEYERIKNTIENTDYYDLEHGHKFFLVDKFYLTDYIKISDYGLRSKRYFWLDEINGFKENMTVEEIANLLSKKEWE
ncbi:MAG: hypothetical protein ABIQ40_00635 [Bacteroidia bacterium]